MSGAIARLPLIAEPLIVVCGALGIGTIAARIVGGAELAARTRTWWWIVGFVSAALLLGPVASVLFIAGLSFLGLREFLSIVPFRAADRPALAWIYAAIPIQYGLVLDRWYGLFAICLPIYATAFLTVRLVLLGETRGFLRSAGTMHLALIVAVYNLSHLAFLVVLPLRDPARYGGAGLLLFILVTVQAGDVAQYAAGRAFGAARIVPGVSPGKTWAGFAGGLAATTLLGAGLGPRLTPFHAASGAAIGCLLGALGFAGDITLSAVKRDLGLKDTGRLLPGHGGLLDRLDSLIFAAPVFFHLLRFLHGA